MKRIVLFLVSLFLLFPLVVEAQMEVLDFPETVRSIGLDFKHTEYVESSDQIVVYLFRMETCNHCHDEITWLNEMDESMVSKFKLRSLEVSRNAENNALYERVVKHLNIKEGVPLLIVGHEYVRGFTEERKSQIEKLINDAYENHETYDLIKEVEKEENDEQPEDGKKSSLVVMIMFMGLAVVVIVASVLFIKSK